METPWPFQTPTGDVSPRPRSSIMCHDTRGQIWMDAGGLFHMNGDESCRNRNSECGEKKNGCWQLLVRLKMMLQIITGE